MTTVDGVEKVIFLNGKSESQFRRDMKRTLEKIGVRTLTPHSCRHTFHRLLERAGVSEADRKRMLGHSLKGDITNGVYGHRSVEELKSCVAFEDSVALGNYDVDIHNPVGTGTYIYRLKEGDYYRIPYRSLLPKELCNVLAAGRCLSADHGAHSAVRIMPICACLGEAAGLAAALCQKTASDAHSLDVSLLQAKLKEKGARF